MFLHAISPSRAFAKVSKSLLKRTELDPAARLLLAYVGDLKPSDEAYRPLAYYAEELGISAAAYKRIKKELVRYGYLHDHRAQGARGRWFTDQWVSNVPLTEEEFRALRAGEAVALPSDGRQPAVGQPRGRAVGGSTGTSQTNSKTYPTRPPKRPAADAVAEATVVTAVKAEDANAPQLTQQPEFAVAERLLRELGLTRPDLRLSFRNVRYLAGVVAEKIRSGVPAWEIHHALTHGLPDKPIDNAAGFVTVRLRRHVPDAAALAASDAVREATCPPVAVPAPPRAVRTCDDSCGRGFRPVGDETLCAACRRAYPQLEGALREENPGQVWAPVSARPCPEPAF